MISGYDYDYDYIYIYTYIYIYIYIYIYPLMKDLTASDGTLFEPFLNGWNHGKNSNGAVESI